MKKHRITIDLSDSPEVFERIKRTAELQERSMAAQLKFECLPVIAARQPANEAEVKTKPSATAKPKRPKVDYSSGIPGRLNTTGRSLKKRKA